MGTYDTYAGVQLKIGPCILNDYEIGEEVPIDDGIYYAANDGFIVIHDGVLIMCTEYITDKYGNELLPNKLIDNNPIVTALEEVKELYGELGLMGYLDDHPDEDKIIDELVEDELIFFSDLDGEDFMEEVDV